MRRLLWTVIGLGVALGAACSTSDGDTSSGGTPGVDASPQGDGSTTGDGAPKDDATAQQDAAVDAPSDGAGDEDANVTPGTFTLTSTAFAPGAFIPVIHTLGSQPNCNGASESPPLVWSNAPAGTMSYAIVMRDISLVGMPNYHWVIYDIPAGTTSLPQNVQKAATPAVPAGAKQTYWSFGNNYSYLGPCPPNEHNYEFTVYSFETATIPVPGATTDPAIADGVIQMHKKGSASLTGKYQP